MSYNTLWIHSGPLYQDFFFSSEKTSIDKTLRAEKQRNEAEKQPPPPPPGLFSSYLCLVIGTNNLFDKQNVRSWNFIMICWKIAVKFDHQQSVRKFILH